MFSKACGEVAGNSEHVHLPSETELVLFVICQTCSKRRAQRPSRKVGGMTDTPWLFPDIGIVTFLTCTSSSELIDLNMLSRCRPKHGSAPRERRRSNQLPTKPLIPGPSGFPPSTMFPSSGSSTMIQPPGLTSWTARRRTSSAPRTCDTSQL